jgi:hypothetical protein
LITWHYTVIESHDPKALVKAGVRLDRAAGRKGSEAWCTRYWKYMEKMERRKRRGDLNAEAEDGVE